MKKVYPKYRSIELPWLSKIPDHWTMVPNKHLFYLSKELVGESSGDYTLLSLTLNGVIKRDMENPKGKFPAEFDTYQVVEPRDLVFCLFDVEETPRAVGLSPFNGMITGAYTVAKCLANTSEEYLYYYYLFLDNKKSLKYFYTGLRNVIAKDTFGAIKTPLPPLPEQRQIAAFLDHKCALIDTFIQKKTRLIELLKEQKQAIINKAVTKGIDPNVRLKPSGIDWLGDIPEHWEVKKLKYVVSKVGSGVTPKGGATSYVDEGIPLLRSQNIYNEKFSLEEVAFITKDTHDSMANSKVVEGDVLLNITGGSLGRCFFFTDEFPEANVNQHVCIIRPKISKILTKYLHLLLLAEVGQLQIWKEQTGSGREGLNFEAIKNFFFSIPPVKEQEIIIDGLYVEVEKINGTIERIHREIDLIQEYKTTLIAEAVTGKIDVRDWQPKKVADETEQTLNQVQAYGPN